MRFAKINEKAQLQAAESQLRQELLRVQRKECFHRFEFGNYFCVHDQVGAERFIKWNVIVQYRHGFLTSRSQASLLQFVSEYHFIYRLEQPRTELRVNSKSRV